MGAVTFAEETHSPVPAPRMFKALFIDGDNLLPKILPQMIKSIETIQGEGGPGTIKQMNFGEASPYKYVKHRIDALDKENMTYAYTLTEGDAFEDKIESIYYEIKLASSPEGGCIHIITSTLRTQPGVELKEEELKAGKEMGEGIFKAVEAYLLANPDA